MKQLLIVDDDPDVLEALAFALDHEFEVETARDGQAALERLAERTFDVVLLDYTMPRVDGASVIRELRRRQDRVPVLLGSALPEAEQLARNLRVQALHKPYDMERLIQTLHQLAATHETRVQAAQGF